MVKKLSQRRTGMLTKLEPCRCVGVWSVVVMSGGEVGKITECVLNTIYAARKGSGSFLSRTSSPTYLSVYLLLYWIYFPKGFCAVHRSHIEWVQMRVKEEKRWGRGYDRVSIKASWAVIDKTWPTLDLFYIFVCKLNNWGEKANLFREWAEIVATGKTKIFQNNDFEIISSGGQTGKRDPVVLFVTA